MGDSPFFLVGSDVLLYSNEVEFSLPVPEEILSALVKPKDEDGSEADEELQVDGGPARELLLVAESVFPESSITPQSGVEKLSLTTVVSKLPTIHEDQQLDILVADAEEEVMADASPTENSDSELEVTEQQSDFELLDSREENDNTFVEEYVSTEKEAVLEETPHGALIPDESQVEDDAYSEMTVKLNETIFRGLGESVCDNDENVESLVEKAQISGSEIQQLDSRDAGETEFGEEYDVHHTSSKSSTSFVNSKLSDDDNSIDQHEKQGSGSSDEEVPDHSDVTRHTENENNKIGVATKLDNETETLLGKLSDEQRDADFWDRGEKQHEEGTTRVEINSQDATSQNDEDYDKSNATDPKEHPDLETAVADTGKEGHVQEDSCFKGLERITFDAGNHEDKAREHDVGLDTNDGVIPELGGESNKSECRLTEKDHSISEFEEVSKPGNTAVNKENVQLNSQDPLISKDEEYRDNSDDAEVRVAIVNESDEEVSRGLKCEDPPTDRVTGAVDPLQESVKEISSPKQGDEEQNKDIFRGISKIDQTMSSENVASSENETVATGQELKTETRTPHKGMRVETTSVIEGDKQTSHERRDTWSASNNLGSIKNEDDEIKDVMETTEMPTFEEAALVEIEDNGWLDLDREKSLNERIPWGMDGLQGEIHLNLQLGCYVSRKYHSTPPS